MARKSGGKTIPIGAGNGLAQKGIDNRQPVMARLPEGEDAYESRDQPKGPAHGAHHRGGVSAMAASLLPATSSAQSPGADFVIAEPVPATTETTAPKPTESSPFAPLGTVSAFDNSCGSGQACFWEFAGYEGAKAIVLPSACCGWVSSPFQFRSVKNRYGDRRFEVRGNQSGEYNCFNPGGELSILGLRTQFRVGASGSRC